MKLPLSDFIIDFDVLTAVNDNVLVYTNIKYSTMKRTKNNNNNNDQMNEHTKRLDGTHKKKTHTENTTYEIHCTYTFNVLANKVVTK